MKKIILTLLAVVLLAGPALAWVYPGSTADNPLINRYITNLYTNTISALSGGAITVGDTLKGSPLILATIFKASGAGGSVASSNTSVEGASQFILYDNVPTVQSSWATYNTSRATVWHRGQTFFSSAQSYYLNPAANKNFYFLVGAITDSTKILGKWDSLGNLRVGPGPVSGYFSSAVCRLDVRGKIGAVNSAGVVMAYLDTLGLSVGAGTLIKKIITGTQVFTALNTVDTTVVSGVVAASRVQITFKGSTVLTGVPVARTTVDSLFVTCAIADTAIARASGYDYQLTNE